MKKIVIILSIIIVVGMSVIGLYADNSEEKKTDTFHTGPSIFIFDPFLKEHTPGGEFYTTFLENYAPDATLSLEESNGFSLIDNPRVYFEGDSYIHFNWFYNGQRINSALNEGSPGVLLPFSSVSGYRLQGENPAFQGSGLVFMSPMPDKSYSQITASGVYSDLGSYIGTWAIQPDHPTVRADRLYNYRRKNNDNFYLDYRLSRSMERSSLLFTVNYFDIQRQFNDFNVFDTTYSETGKLLTMNGRYKRDLENGSLDIYGVFNYLDRSNQNAELGSYPQETSLRKRNSFLAGIAYNKNKLNLGLSVLVENEDLKPVVENFSKDLVDNDGDLLYPYGGTSLLRLGEFTGTTLNLTANYRHKSGALLIEPYIDARYSMIKGDETNHDFNAILFDGDPYQVVVWNPGTSYTNSNLDATAGLKLQFQLSNRIALLGKVLVRHNRLDFDDNTNNISFTTPGFDAGILVKLSSKGTSHLLFSYGRLPYPIAQNTNFFLERQRPGGTIFRWSDSNGDGQYQAGEEGTIYGYTGGNTHYVSEDISAPVNERLMLHFSTKISKNFVLNIKGIYKKIRNNLRVRFQQEYGTYETHGQYDLYFFDQPFQDYYLGSGGYEKDPFYAGLHFNFKGRRADRWFFSFSFLAHMGMGATAFGNGPASNDFGILDESQANPNSLLNSFGRVDAERGFVAKSYFGYYLAKRLFVAVSLKYRDGNPFAFLESVSAHDQRVIYYSTIKGEDEKGNKGGPREDYLADVSVQLNYSFKLFNGDARLKLSFLNLLDFGAELSEYVYSGGLRDAVEMQIPRSARLTFEWQF